jgi:hypothetical protein
MIEFLKFAGIALFVIVATIINSYIKALKWGIVAKWWEDKFYDTEDRNKKC